MKDRAPSLVSPAQRALRTLLSAAYDDPDRATEVVGRALALADREILPQESREVLEFARDYLETIVADTLGARLAAALLHDLEEELAVLRAPREASTTPPPRPTPPPAATSFERIATPLTVRVPNTSPPASIGDTIRSYPAPPNVGATIRSYPAPPAPPAAPPEPPPPVPPVPAAPAAPARPRRAKGSRAIVLLVDTDRFGRAPLARALVRGGCDVTAVETIAEVNATLSAHEPLDIVIIDADHLAFESLLRIIVTTRPEIAILARADRVANANSKLLVSGAKDFAVRAKSALPKDLLELVARFARSE